MKTPSVLLIGCGPAGIAQMCTFSQANFKVTCFEQGSEIGGLWTYSDKVGDDVHQSMYRYHQTNGLNEMLELPDYSFVEHFGHATTSYPPRAVMLDYLQGWARKWNVQPTLNRKVVSVTFDDSSSKFTVCSEDTRNASRYWDFFDYVVVATGHFSKPNYIPPYPGMEHFEGFSIHSHNFRDATDHAGKRLLIIGNGYSGEDIAMQCAKFGAESCTVCYQFEPMGVDFKQLAIIEKPLPTHFDAATNEFVFKDGSRGSFDGVIYCTGYKHHFPFLAPELQLQTNNRLVPNTLWKGILFPDCPRLMYLGMPDQYYTFSAFHAQSKFVLGVIQGRVNIPSAKEMLADTAAWQVKEDSVGDDHKDQHRLQWAHTEEAAALAGCHLRNDEKFFDQWLDDRHHDILTYRDQTAVSDVSGVASLSFGMPWVKMFTDDKYAYLAWCKAQHETLKKQKSKL
jgi:trimethylamine monooxygenase